MPYISDVEQLGYLSPIARRFGVRFRLHGGVAFRLLAGVARGEPPFDLFELTPFASDIDLVHTGSAHLTGTLLQEILQEVPAAECFRWELRTEAEQRNIERTMGSVGAVPARTISVLDAPGGQVVDPASGLLDISSKQFRYHFNPYFGRSDRFSAGRDIPAFSAFLYLQSLFEAGIPAEQLHNQPGWDQAAAAMRACEEIEVRRKLEEHSYLRSRLWYLALNAYAAAPNRSDFHTAAESLGLKNILKSAMLPASLSPLNLLVEGSMGMMFTSSAHLLGDAFRFPQNWSVAPNYDSMDIRLGARQSVLFAMQPIVMTSGTAPSVAKAAAGSEFVHLVLPGAVRRACVQVQDDARLSAIVQFGNGREPWISAPLPCVVQRKGPTDERIFLRLNFFGFPDAMTTAGLSSARLYLIGLSGEE